MDAFLIVVILIAVCLSVPVRYDPAFWLKEFNERKRRERHARKRLH